MTFTVTNWKTAPVTPVRKQANPKAYKFPLALLAAIEELPVDGQTAVYIPLPDPEKRPHGFTRSLRKECDSAGYPVRVAITADGTEAMVTKTLVPRDLPPAA